MIFCKNIFQNIKLNFYNLIHYIVFLFIRKPSILDECSLQVIEWSKENTSGTIVDFKSIRYIIYLCVKDNIKDLNKIDDLINEFFSKKGFLTKSSDIMESIGLIIPD